MTTHEYRKQEADSKATPAFYFSYVLELDDGTFYVGSTNSPMARWTEHAAGVGAKATAGKAFKVRMAMPFQSRREAEYNEERLQQALKQAGPQALNALIGVFDQVINVVRSQKTFSELQREENDYFHEMTNRFHFADETTHVMLDPDNQGKRPMPSTACGWWEGITYSTSDWGDLVKSALDEDINGKVRVRKICRRCFALAPAEEVARQKNELLAKLQTI